MSEWEDTLFTKYQHRDRAVISKGPKSTGFLLLLLITNTVNFQYLLMPSAGLMIFFFFVITQNQPALEKDRYKIRQAFIAAPGKSLIVADYGQVCTLLESISASGFGAMSCPNT